MVKIIRSKGRKEEKKTPASKAKKPTSQSKKPVKDKTDSNKKPLPKKKGQKKTADKVDKKEKRKSFLRSLIKSVDTGANGTQDYIVKKGSGKNKIATTRQ